MANRPARGAQTYTISELAKEFALTTRAIRFYEDCGLITPQREGSARVYGERERVRMKLVLRGKRLGLSLAEIEGLERECRRRLKGAAAPAEKGSKGQVAAASADEGPALDG